MKKIFTKTITLIILFTGLLINIPTFADDPPSPPSHGEVGDIPAGGGAPIGMEVINGTNTGKVKLQNRQKA
jgi:hypothetical protein